MSGRRWDILVNLLRDRNHEVGAEIGVFEGDTTVHLLTRLPNLKKFIWVDPFEHYPEHTATLKPSKPKFYDADFIAIEKKFRTLVDRHKKSIEIIPVKMYSHTAVRYIQNESLDFAFIDGNHAYDYVKTDIENWLPKIKVGGILAGHDYNVKGYKNRFGVNRAVKEAFGNKFDFKNHVWWHERYIIYPTKLEL